VKSKAVREVIPNQGLDLKSASLGPDAIVYEQFGGISIYDLKSGKTKTVPIRVQADLPELALGDVDHLLQRVPKLTVVGFSIGRVPLQSKPSPRMRLNQTGQSMANPTRQPGK